jgi:hypothetical protein
VTHSWNPTTWEVEIRRIRVSGQPGQKLRRQGRSGKLRHGKQHLGMRERERERERERK